MNGQFKLLQHLIPVLCTTKYFVNKIIKFVNKIIKR